MDKHVSAKFVACLFPDSCSESVRTALDFVDNRDILVYRDTDKFYFRYISGGHIKVSYGLNYFVYGDTLYHYNQYCHAYDFIESKIKETIDKDTFDLVKKWLICVHILTKRLEKGIQSVDIKSRG